MNGSERIAQTQQSWNHATLAHNAHKADQAKFLRNGGSTVFAEELGLLGPLTDRRLLHTLCNSGQDTLSLAAKGAIVVGVDLSDEAIAFAQTLSKDSGIPGAFYHDEIINFLEGPGEPEPFELAFASYGCLAWIEDLPRYFRGIAQRMAPAGRLAVVEFHPMAWSFGKAFALADPYFAPGHAFAEPVSDYVAEAAGGLSPSGHIEIDAPYDNAHTAYAYQHTVADILNAVITAGFTLEQVCEWPYANGCRVTPELVQDPNDPARYTTPPGVPLLPWMFGFSAAMPA